MRLPQGFQRGVQRNNEQKMAYEKAQGHSSTRFHSSE